MATPEDKMGGGDFAGVAKSEHEHQPAPAWLTGLRVLGLLATLYAFLIGLALMGDGFNIVAGKSAGSMFGNNLENPITGLMIGIVGTVLVQSSSTSTSIVVVLVGADQISVRDAVPIIMGANIGTSVTNTLVSMGHMADRKELKRSFAGATVHDMFNILAVITLLPIEIITRGSEGQGIIERIAYAMTKWLIGERTKPGESPLFESPVKRITKPVTGVIATLNKDLVKSVLPLSVTRPGVQENEKAGLVNREGTCSAAQDLIEYQDAGAWVSAERRLASFDGKNNCAKAGDKETVVCVGPDLNKAWLKLKPSKKEPAYWADQKYSCTGKLLDADTVCQGIAGNGWICGWNANEFWTTHVLRGDMVTGGLVGGMNDQLAGLTVLALSFILLVGGLFFLVKILHVLLLGPAKEMITRAADMNDYLAILVGCAMTILVQSSSITTSALTPLVGIGVLKVEKMFPVTLGANIGTTSTGLIAAAAELKFNKLNIALCHFMFNIIGILIWFPLPFTRAVPIRAAKVLGLYASFYKWVPLIYILVAFLLVPTVLLLTSFLYENIAWLGFIIFILELCGIVAFVVYWNCMGGAYKVLTEEQRKEVEDEDEAESGMELTAKADPDQEA